MFLDKMKYPVRFFCMFLAVSVLTVSIFPVYAVDSVDSLEQSASELESELSGLNNELDQISSEISSIAQQIQDTAAEIEQVKADLAIAKGEEAAQYEAMKTRIVYMYENGNSSLLEMLFSSTSMADFLNRAEFFSTISEYDRALLEKLVDTQEAIAEKESLLAKEQENLLTLQEDLNEKEEALTSQISATSQELSTFTAQLEKAREELQNAQDSLEEEVVPVEPEPEPEEPVESGSENSNSGNESDAEDDSEDENIAASASDVELFAALIECEAGSTDYEGMLAVASVVVNRMKNRHYPDTLRGVIYQSGQFTPAHNGKLDKVLKRGVKSSCVAAANDALAGKNNVGDCLSFRSADSGHTGIIIGDNVFF